MLKHLSSLKFAIVLIGILVVLSIIASFLPDLNIYQSIIFRGTIILFTINLLLCTFRRLPEIINKLNKEPQDTKGQVLELSDSQKCEQSIKKYLKDKGFKYKEISLNEKQLFLAQRNYLNLLAPHLLHISLVIILIGAFLSSFGVEGKVMCYEGEKAKIPSQIADNMYLKLNKFKTIYDERGAVDNWVSDITIYVNDKKVAQGNTMVNHPFNFKGIMFYQSSFGYSHLIEIHGEQKGSYRIPDGKVFKLGVNHFNLYYVEKGIKINVYEKGKLVDSKILNPGEILNINKNTNLEYLKIYPYTVLSVKRDPGTKMVMLGFLMLAISSLFFWFGRYCEIKGVLNKNENKLVLNIYCRNRVFKEEVLSDITKITQED